jgi:hypothetical protein
MRSLGSAFRLPLETPQTAHSLFTVGALEAEFKAGHRRTDIWATAQTGNFSMGGMVEIVAKILLRISREFVESSEWLLTGKINLSDLVTVTRVTK